MASRNGVQPRNSMGSGRRKLRLRQLHEDVVTMDDNENNFHEKIQKTKEVVEEVDKLLANGTIDERGNHPSELLLDSKVVRACSDQMMRFAETISGIVNTYDRHELAMHIKSNSSIWRFGFPREVPPVAYLHGTFAPTPPEQRPRPQRARAARQQTAALTVPENVQELNRGEEGSEMVNRVDKFIRHTHRDAKRPLSYFHLVLDPGSFARTVENVYLISFLVRQGNVSIDLDPDHELPMLSPVRKLERAPDATVDNQFIVSLDIQRWQDLVAAFRIREPMMVIQRTA